MSLTMSSANLIGLAVLENPRPDSGDLKPGKAPEPILACLRYFNSTDIPFEELGTFFVYATVAKMVKGANTRTTSTTLSDDDYHLVGDIVWLIAADVEDAKHLPYIQVSGTVKNIKTDDATFEIDAAQYTTPLKDKRGDSTFPLHVFIPSSPRYKTKPVPKPNSTVFVTGFLTGTDISQSGEANRFHIEMDNITFLGRSTLPLQTTSPVPVQTAEGGKKRKLKYSFDSPNPLSSKRAKQSPNVENVRVPLLPLSQS
ncbi:hypothetical protein Hypma_015706 [Hypsizygus marmoreus]|uniref:Uncharacterized protein n=1 Tax=Hypsizygus marmoreus TaxID=39966 RepID=A0A369K477_HYPMA|nr:hypothetical protein Hypma_015706 [Hypsizygus marmoreus]